MSENLRNYTKSLYAMDAVVRRVADDAWDRPSPCDGWSAREALGHTVWNLKRLTASIAGTEPPAEQAEAEVAGDDPLASWTAAMDAMLAALDHKDALSSITATPFGEMPVDHALGSLFIDPLTHAFDIAKATGVDHGLPAGLAEKALGVMTPLGDLIRRPGLFGEAISLDGDHSVVDAFIAYTGRQP